MNGRYCMVYKWPCLGIIKCSLSVGFSRRSAQSSVRSSRWLHSTTCNQLNRRINLIRRHSPDHYTIWQSISVTETFRCICSRMHIMLIGAALRALCLEAEFIAVSTWSDNIRYSTALPTDVTATTSPPFLGSLLLHRVATMQKDADMSMKVM